MSEAKSGQPHERMNRITGLRPMSYVGFVSEIGFMTRTVLVKLGRRENLVDFERKNFSSFHDFHGQRPKR